MSESRRSELRVVAPQNDSELDALLQVLMPIFRMTPELGHRYGVAVGMEHFRIAWMRKALAGGLALLPMGQYFGGRRVPTTGIAAVGVASEFRGTGVATELMRSVLAELSSRRVALSTLYPATLPLYRRVGYELAGGTFEVALSLRMLAPQRCDHEIRRIVDADAAQIARLYTWKAERTPGYLDRSEFIWKGVRHPRGVAAQGYVAVKAGTNDAEGYLYYTQKDSREAYYLLALTDFVAVTPDAARSLLGFLRDHRSMADLATWQGGAIDPIVSALPERVAKVRLADHWMLRIVDIGSALSERGYPAGLTAELHLDVRDDVITANAGRFVLEVAGGRGQVRAGGEGHLQIDIRGLAALYSGFMSPAHLHMSGLLSAGADGGGAHAAESMAVASAIFAGAAPVMCDGF